MNKKIMYGICEWAFPVQGPYFIKMSSQMGFDGVELDLGAYEHNFTLSNKRVYESYLEEAEKWGISFSALAVNALCQYGMRNPKGSKPRDIAEYAIEKSVETAYAMGIDIIQLPSFEDGYINTESEFESLVECIKYACNLAQDKGILITTENVLSVDENIRLIHEVDMPNVGVYFDTQNPYLRKGYYVPDMIKDLSEFIVQVHVKDGKDGELSAALLGQGATDYFNSIKALKENLYQGWIILENFYDQRPMNNGGLDPFALIEEDFRILKGSIGNYNK